MSATTTEVKAPIDVKDISWRARWASIAIRENLAAIQKEIDALPNKLDKNHLVPIKKTLHTDGTDINRPLKVGIIGAGCAGLFTAMIFDHLKEEYHLDVEYEILEAASEDRLGGRLFSYYFKEHEVKNPGPHDYFDVGAMRFPEIKIMDRTFALFKELRMKNVDPEKATPAKGDLIPYYLKGKNTPELYNDVQIVRQESDKPATGKTFNITGVSEPNLSIPPGTLIDDKISEFTKLLLQDPVKGWKNLKEKGDQFSVRSFLSLGGIDYNTIEWLETYNFGNRWYDQAFSEMVLEDLDFNHDKPWSCIEGGAQEIAHKMAQSLQQRDVVQFGKRVSAMKLRWASNIDNSNKPEEVVDVTIKGEESSTRTYDAVFNSAPLGSMQRMELTGLNLNWGTKQAIRSLGYGASCKVGIRFKSLWWMSEDFNITKGGVSKTDLPLRACVYPSYNIYPADKGKAGVLLVSYSWSQEAQRIASLINRKSPQDELELRDVLVRDLARLHSKSKPEYGKPDNGWQEDFAKTYKIINEAYESHYAYDWYADPHTSGAFAYFGPGQFQNMYPWVTRNNGKHVIIGEAASAHHAWVVGALESAVRGVYQFLFRHSAHSTAAHNALQAYNDGKVDSPYGPLPFEYDRSKDIEQMESEYGEAEKADPNNVPLASEGEWARAQVLFEMIRMEQGGDMVDSKSIAPEQIAPMLEVAVKA
ncbi:MAG: hypothetical protein M1828_004174 [Chrysothrix sp. TS-e1954]|nr:MAG: hypothetical protein M1828_004174 [Chrysothrix sp. TS-e1954]